jgi:hypothetical protein
MVSYKRYGSLSTVALKIPLFLCQWVELTGGGIRKDQYGMTIVDLAKNVQQVFYVKDMTRKPKNTNPQEGPRAKASHCSSK